MIKYTIKTHKDGTYEHILQGNCVPECGKDFCDACGDCLHCYWEDACYGNNMGEHIWVEYVWED